MDNQDWTPVDAGHGVKNDPETIKKLTRLGKAKKEIIEKRNASKNPQQTSKSDLNPKKIEENEIWKVPTPTLKLSLQVQKARTAKKMTQEEVDKACNFPKYTTLGYENGKGIIDSKQLEKMSKILGVVLKK